MEPVTAIALAGTLLSLLGKGVSSSKRRKFEKQQEEYAKEQQLKAEKEARRRALMQAVGAKTIFAPQAQGFGPQAPNTAAWDIIGGIGQAAGSLAATGAFDKLGSAAAQQGMQGVSMVVPKSYGSLYA